MMDAMFQNVWNSECRTVTSPVIRQWLDAQQPISRCCAEPWCTAVTESHPKPPCLVHAVTVLRLA